jgi:hypothetical protein
MASLLIRHTLFSLCIVPARVLIAFLGCWRYWMATRSYALSQLKFHTGIAGRIDGKDFTFFLHRNADGFFWGRQVGLEMSANVEEADWFAVISKLIPIGYSPRESQMRGAASNGIDFRAIEVEIHSPWFALPNIGSSFVSAVCWQQRHIGIGSIGRRDLWTYFDNDIMCGTSPFVVEMERKLRFIFCEILKFHCHTFFITQHDASALCSSKFSGSFLKGQHREKKTSDADNAEENGAGRDYRVGINSFVPGVIVLLIAFAIMAVGIGTGCHISSTMIEFLSGLTIDILGLCIAA